MSKLLRAVVVASLVASFIAIQPMVAMATSTPSPALSGVLAAPPTTDFKELPATTPGVFEGAFDAKGFVTLNGTPDPTNDQKTMENDGFLSGFGRTWIQASSNRVFVEAVLAFNGGVGATRWMRQSETADKGLSGYKNALTVSGVANYYGAHIYDSTAKLYSDGFVVVKGNDAFLVVFASGKDDLGSVASTQAKKQYDTAPDSTIPKSEWPESKIVAAAFDVGKVVIGLLVGILVLAVVVGAAVFLMRRRSRPTLQAVPAYVGAGGAAAPPVQAQAIQMSDDRRSWWDGTAWRNAEQEVPPSAQRSQDGHFWWDGQAWRPMPGA